MLRPKELNLLTSSLRLFQVEDALVEPLNVLSAVLRMLRKQWKNMIIQDLVVEALQFISADVENVVINGNINMRMHS